MSDYYNEFDENGFVLVKGGIPKELLERLRNACEPIIGNRGEDARHQTILEPNYFDCSFVDFLNLPELQKVVENVLQTDPSFSGIGVLLGSYVTRLCDWHRDFADDHPDVNELQDSFSSSFMQYNCALYDDQSLWVVPGSHRRRSTQGEKDYASAALTDDQKNALTHKSEYFQQRLADMPGAINVKLQAGDCLLYNPVMWHGARYEPEWKRATLHGGWKDPAIIDRFESQRWGIDHNPWLSDPSYMGELGSFFGAALDKFRAYMKAYT